MNYFVVVYYKWYICLFNVFVNYDIRKFNEIILVKDNLEIYFHFAVIVEGTLIGYYSIKS